MVVVVLVVSVVVMVWVSSVVLVSMLPCLDPFEFWPSCMT
jgi:hypothetical protein